MSFLAVDGKILDNSNHVSHNPFLAASKGPFGAHYSPTGEVLGKGSYASVATYRHRHTLKDFAVKVVNITSKTRQDQARKEIKICLQHRDCENILRLEEFFEEEGMLYLVFEKIDGGDLFEVLSSRGHLTERSAARVVKGVATALKDLHSKGIAHRDIKPENVLCLLKNFSEEPNHVKLCDFNLSNDVSELRAVVGSTDFMPPEIVRNRALQPKEPYTKNCDLWSLGVVLFEMLFGYLPFLMFCGGGGVCERGVTDPVDCSDCRDQTRCAIKKGKYSFPENAKFLVSDSAIDLVKRLLVVNSSARLSAEGILQHPFVSCSEV